MCETSDGAKASLILQVSSAIEQLLDISDRGQNMLRAADVGGDTLAGRVYRVSGDDLAAIRHNSDALLRMAQIALTGLKGNEYALHLAAGALIAHEQLAVIFRKLEDASLVAYTQKTAYSFVPLVVLFLYGRQFAGTEMLLEALSPGLGELLGTKGY